MIWGPTDGFEKGYDGQGEQAKFGAKEGADELDGCTGEGEKARWFYKGMKVMTRGPKGPRWSCRGARQ